MLWRIRAKSCAERATIMVAAKAMGDGGSPQTIISVVCLIRARAKVFEVGALVLWMSAQESITLARGFETTARIFFVIRLKDSCTHRHHGDEVCCGCAAP